MPNDITLCGGANCPLKENCLRYTAVVYGRQDFFGNIPYDFATTNCDYYWDERPSEDNTRLLAYQLWCEDGQKSGRDLDYWLLALNQLINRIRNS